MNLFSLLVNKNSTLKKALPMNPNAALYAELLAKTIPEVELLEEPDKCMMQPALAAANHARFHLNPEMIVRFIAVTALKAKEDNNILSTLRGVFFFSIYKNFDVSNAFLTTVTFRQRFF